jgi:hypothetical protein
MASPSTSCVLTELDEILDDENIDEFSFGDDRFFASVYTQLVTAGTNVISDNESDNSGNEQEENKNTGLGGVSNKSMWQNTGLFPASQETFYNVYGSLVLQC